jgi:dipeptidyl aminopeptidase/acylaminoacyl peptidase
MLASLFALALTGPPNDRPLYRPSTEEVARSYHRADTIGDIWSKKAAMLRLEPHWIDGGSSFWYLQDRVGGGSSYVRVSCATGDKTALFDHVQLANALGRELQREVDPAKLPIRNLEFDGKSARFVVDRQSWMLDLGTYGLKKLEAEVRPPRENRGGEGEPWPADETPVASPDRQSIARIDGESVLVTRGGRGERRLATNAGDGYFARLTWTPDSKALIGVKVHPGDRKKVYTLQSAPPKGGSSVLAEHYYDRPGDKVDTFSIYRIDVAGARPPKLIDTVEYGDMPWFRPTKDGALTYQKTDRGYGRLRVMRYDPTADQESTIFDDDPATFVDTTAFLSRDCEKTDEMIVSSERDGWHHLYLADGKGGLVQITRGPWVVRGIVDVDEDSRQLVFSASGMDPQEDPYFIHYYRINFDGTGLVPLTPAKGNHQAVLSPDGKWLLDTYSTVIKAPMHELRRADSGVLISLIDKADVKALVESDWRPPQPFVAKGRDGRTDIFGLVFRPTKFDRTKKYPVVEDIYAGPQDSFVPKSFSANFYDQRVAELGFIVVKIDGMGTRNRSKAFHDVCYQNLGDAGFPDRILWMKALAKTDPSVDLSRVGVFGTSAGGQNAGGAVLFHPEFYKVAVASCGCHDNRLDKIWWNEQWMGPIGPHYAASSNIDNAAKLKGKLLLMVGEIDTNVPPESTYRFAAALQNAGKEFELVVIPNSDHTAGGPYGERKRRDFLVRNLLGVEPPNPN